MATSFNVNLTITSAVGYRRASTQTFINSFGTATIGGVNGPRPILTTTYTLNGVTQPDIVISGTKIISATTTTDFYLYPGGTSSVQNIYITNQGNSPLSLVAPYYEFSDNSTVCIVNDFQPSSKIIAPNSTGTLSISYTGNEPGEFYNYILLLTNADSPQFKIITKQVVADDLTFEVDPLSVSVSSTSTGFKTTATYTITPIYNGAEDTGIILPIVASLTSSTGWTLESNENNQVKVRFNANTVNNVTGTYTSTLTLSYGLTTITRTNTAYINVDYSDDYNIGSWLSAGSAYDAIVGMSYDVIDNQRYLTIGLGADADGAPIYGYGGAEYIDLVNLNYSAGTYDDPYPYWGKVYRFPIYTTGISCVYFSNDYVVKNTGTNYGYYFGENQAPGSIFIVENDGYGNLIVKVNHLRELTEESNNVVDITLQNLKRIFYDYSGVDLGPGRYTQNNFILEDGVSTRLFVGFDNQGGIRSYPVPLPTV